MRRLGIVTALLTLLMAVTATVALAQVSPGVYPGSINNANAPASSHLASGTIQCVVDAQLNVNCSAYVIGGVGNTDGAVSLTANYSATIDCTNKGGNLVESHTANFSAGDSDDNIAARNGQLSVPALSANPFEAPQICPNRNWDPSIRAGTLVLESFTYSLTFDGFSAPAVLISEP